MNLCQNNLEKMPMLWVWELSQLSSKRTAGEVALSPATHFARTMGQQLCAKKFEEARMPSQHALSTPDCVARVVRSMMELDPTKIWLSIDGTGVSHGSPLEALHNNVDLATGCHLFWGTKCFFLGYKIFWERYKIFFWGYKKLFMGYKIFLVDQNPTRSHKLQKNQKKIKKTRKSNFSIFSIYLYFFLFEQYFHLIFSFIFYSIC